MKFILALGLLLSLTLPLQLKALKLDKSNRTTSSSTSTTKETSSSTTEETPSTSTASYEEDLEDQEESTTVRRQIINNCLAEHLLCEQIDDIYRPTRCALDGLPQNISNLVYCNSTTCEPERFVHDYITRNHDQSPHENRWKRARIGEAATLHDVCLLRNGLPVTRKCQINHFRAKWESVDHWKPVVCLRRVRERTISTQLNSLHDDILEGRRRPNDTQSRRQMTATMRDMFRQHDRTVLPADIHVTTQVFTSLMDVQRDPAVSTDLVSVCKEIMSSDAQVLRLSAELNATNNLVSKFEDYMNDLTGQMVPKENCGKVVIQAAKDESETGGVESVNFSDIGVQALMTSNLSVLFVNPQCDGITGIAIYSSPYENLRVSKSGFWYRFLHSTENINRLKLDSNLEAATFVPQNLWNSLKKEGATYLVIKVYAHDGLFVEMSQQRSRRPRSKVISISIPGYEASTLPGELPFLLRNDNHHQPDARAISLGSGCGYWNYKTWLSDGITVGDNANMLHDPVIHCKTRHLTQFSFLLGGSYRTNDLGEEVLVTPLNERVLDIISIVGCCLSLFGLIGIFLTAGIFRSWRNQASTKVLLHLCLALTLQMILFVFLNTDDVSEQLVVQGDNLRCVALGAILQYSILVLFSWMLIIAFLQFQRYVTVIGIKRPSHYILKSAIVAWSLPLLPTLLVAFIDPNSYLPTESQLATDTGICYPSGYGLTFGVVLPVTIITIANFAIFVYVFYSISHSLSQSIHKSEKQMVYKQIRLSVLLFFLLGLTWIFGIFSFMQAGVAFSYLFCLTATMQGFVLFIYFVVLDKDNRRAWLGLLCPTKKFMDVEKRTAELQSMTTSSTNFTNRVQP